MEFITKKISSNEPIIAANGFISRDLFDLFDKASNFYMIGSMGLASSIGLGVAMKNPKKRIFIFDGDGNILMNLGSLTTIGSVKPRNLIHVVFDNSSHESTGGQPTNSNKISIVKIAQAANYQVFSASNKKELEKIMKKINSLDGPIMILVKVSRTEIKSKRVDILPKKIHLQFSEFLTRL